MKKIFEPVELGKLTIRNRLVRSATYEYGAANLGKITPLFQEIYRELGEGGIGLIITGMVAVNNTAILGPDMVDAGAPDFVEGYGKLVEAVRPTGVKIVVQLNHTGMKGYPVRGKGENFAPSDIENKAKAMTKEEIRQLVEDFGKAAAKCKEAGADGVQIHGAHGYLLSQFLSPYFNRRTDEYGGTIENRARIVFEVYDEVRRWVGEDYPILIKINRSDMVEEGLTFDECLWVCGELEKRGIDAIELSVGISVSAVTTSARSIKNSEDEGYSLPEAEELAERVKVPIISVGGHRTLESMEESLNKSKVAAFSLSRPFIREPDLSNQWREDGTKKPTCISCSKCFLMKRHGCWIDHPEWRAEKKS